LEKPKGEKPHYRLTGRSHGGTDKERWTRIGAAWDAEAKDTRAPYIAIRVEALPLNFDGVMALHRIPEEAADEQRGE
jgi:uncharacterized protein (DUF736 family)